MKIINYCLVLLMPIFLNACASFMTAKVTSTPDPTYNFDKNAVVVVAASEKSKNILETKYYIPKLIQSLKMIGFKNVYPDNQVSEIKAPIGLVMLLNLDHEISSYQYTGADYGLVQSGSNTTCNGYSYGQNTTANCTTTPNSTFGVTGYSQKTGYLNGHYMSIYGIDMQKNQLVLNVFSSTYMTECTDDQVYGFLIDESLRRVDFNRKVEEEIKVKSPNKPCTY